MPATRKRFLLRVLAILAPPLFVFLVPAVPIPYAHYTLCTNYGASCHDVTQYGSLSYIYLCVGAVATTDGDHSVTECMYSSPPVGN